MHLQNDEVHVWQINLINYNDEDLAAFFNLLTPDEQTLAQRFHFIKDQHKFITARAHLRKILGQYLQVKPEDLRFEYNRYGKPSLVDHPLQFNLSHSHELALCAVANSFPLGIDIEYIKTDHDIEAIAQRFFSVNEFKILKTLDEATKIQAFYNAWTRKEAFLKAIGQGLSYSLADVEVTILPNDPPALTFIKDEKENIAEWFLQAFEPTPGYTAALAVKGNPKRIQNIVTSGALKA